MKTALITGISGQDGYYLTKLLLEKNYHVIGTVRRSSKNNITDLSQFLSNNENFFLRYADLTETESISKVISEFLPDEIYNLGAQSDVRVSFDTPVYTADVNGLGTLRLLEIIRGLKNQKNIRFYQASTSELFGKVLETPQNENTRFNPQSPYAISKQFAYWSCVNYRNSYDIFASNGILFNHESPLRGENFVSRKITLGLSRVKLGLQNYLELGNIYSQRDWGHAEDYVEMMWKILQIDSPGDFIISTGQKYSIKNFISHVCEFLDLKLSWEGEGLNEVALDQDKRVIIKINKYFYRPSEVDNLIGDSSLAADKLNWKPKKSFKDLVYEMTKHDYENQKKILKRS